MVNDARTQVSFQQQVAICSAIVCFVHSSVHQKHQIIQYWNSDIGHCGTVASTRKVLPSRKIIPAGRNPASRPSYVFQPGWAAVSCVRSRRPESRSKLRLNHFDGAEPVKHDGHASHIVVVFDARPGADSGICVRRPGFAIAAQHVRYVNRRKSA